MINKHHTSIVSEKAVLGTNVTIDSAERAMVVGPYSIDSDVNLKINGVLTIV